MTWLNPPHITVGSVRHRTTHPTTFWTRGLVSFPLLCMLTFWLPFFSSTRTTLNRSQPSPFEENGFSVFTSVTQRAAFGRDLSSCQFYRTNFSTMLAAPTNPNMKYILVTGGVISGIGKGILASSFGTILKGCGLRVTSIKIDPYLNIDAGTFSPYEHGEPSHLSIVFHLPNRKRSWGAFVTPQYREKRTVVLGG